MGDKSPKSTERLKKQDAAAKGQKKANANAKANQSQARAAMPAKKGK